MNRNAPSGSALLSGIATSTSSEATLKLDGMFDSSGYDALVLGTIGAGVVVVEPPEVSVPRKAFLSRLGRCISDRAARRNGFHCESAGMIAAAAKSAATPRPSPLNAMKPSLIQFL